MTNKKTILGLVGQISSGKGTAADYLEKKYSAKTYKFSTILRDLMERMGEPITRENMQNLSTAIRQAFGEDILAKIIARDVVKDECQIIVVDGIRRPADITYLSPLEGFKLVRIVADPKIRYERLLSRDENIGDDKKSFEEFLADQEKEADAAIPLVMESADLELNNDDEFENLYKQIDDLINSF